MAEEVTLERHLGSYTLPDDAVDLEAWLRDGLAVYNIFTIMKPAFFQMLDALGGTFEVSMRRAADDRLAYRIHAAPTSVGKLGDEDYDERFTIVLTKVQDG